MTAWLSVALTTKDSVCFHEGFLGCASVEDLKNKMGPHKVAGNCDSVNLLFLSDLKETFPDARFVVVWRDEEAVSASIRAIGLDNGLMPALEEAMLEALGEPGVLVVPFSRLLDLDIGQAIWEHCLEGPFDPLRWALLGGVNIQADLDEVCAAVMENKSEVAALLTQKLALA